MGGYMMEWMENFRLWDTKDEGNTCTLSPIQGFERTFRLNHGISLLNNWPSDVFFDMDPEYPKDIGLTDNLQNSDQVIVASKSLISFLQEKNLKGLENLPVAIRNHKGRMIKEEYFIVNPTEPQDCIDLDLCKPTYFSIYPDYIQYVEQLVIDPERIEDKIAIFRLLNFWPPIVVRTELAQEISNQSFTGIEWADPLEYTG